MVARFNTGTGVWETIRRVFPRKNRKLQTTRPGGSIMAVSFGCKCDERAKPIRERNWRVIHRLCNYSAFSGYRWTPSDWSLIKCFTCGALGRTKAKYVERLRDGRLR